MSFGSIWFLRNWYIPSKFVQICSYHSLIIFLMCVESSNIHSFSLDIGNLCHLSFFVSLDKVLSILLILSKERLFDYRFSLPFCFQLNFYAYIFIFSFLLLVLGLFCFSFYSFLKIKTEVKDLRPSFFSNNKHFNAVKFLLSTGLAASHKFGWIVFSFFFFKLQNIF